MADYVPTTSPAAFSGSVSPPGGNPHWDPYPYYISEDELAAELDRRGSTPVYVINNGDPNPAGAEPGSVIIELA